MCTGPECCTLTAQSPVHSDTGPRDHWSKRSQQATARSMGQIPVFVSVFLNCFCLFFCQLSKAKAMPHFFAWPCLQSCKLQKRPLWCKAYNIYYLSLQKKKWLPLGVHHGLWLAPRHVLICTLVLWLPTGGQSLKSKSKRKLFAFSALKTVSIYRPNFFFPKKLLGGTQALGSSDHFSVPFLLSMALHFSCSLWFHSIPFIFYSIYRR